MSSKWLFNGAALFLMSSSSSGKASLWVLFLSNGTFYFFQVPGQKLIVSLSSRENLSWHFQPGDGSDSSCLHHRRKIHHWCFQLWVHTLQGDGPNYDCLLYQGRVLPYMGYIGTCRGIGYGFWRLSILKQGILFAYVGSVPVWSLDRVPQFYQQK